VSKENVTKFGELLRDDEGLREELQAAMAAYEGDAGDERALFDATILPLAERMDLPFSFEDAFTCAESEDVSAEELKAIAGGIGACFILGFSDEPEAVAGGDEAHACAYIGVGVASPQ